MPWKETSVMDQRIEFINEVLRNSKTFTQLCSEYGISEKTGYKWKKRLTEDGINGLTELSRRPKTTPNKLDEDVTIEILKIRDCHNSWRAKKIQEIIRRNKKFPEVPSESSIKRVPDKAGKIRKRKIRVVGENKSRLHQLIPANAPDVRLPLMYGVRNIIPNVRMKPSE